MSRCLADRSSRPAAVRDRGRGSAKLCTALSFITPTALTIAAAAQGIWFALEFLLQFRPIIHLLRTMLAESCIVTPSGTAADLACTGACSAPKFMRVKTGCDSSDGAESVTRAPSIVLH